MGKAASGNQFLNPARILHDIGVRYGHQIADLGCGGAGYFVFQAAKVVGDRGVSYGVDVLKHALSGLQSKIALEGVKNVIPVWSNLERYGATKQIRNGTLDFALIINTLFQAHDKGMMIKEAVRMIALKGKLVIIDWKTGGLSFGPNPSDLVSPGEVERHAQACGMHLEKTFDAGRYHFGMIFVR
ncbi:MAG: methyltransferase domain-containing protein [Parcubacteria group bacterium]